MIVFRKNSILLIASLAYIALCIYLIWIDQPFLTLASIGLMGVYFALFYTEYTFLALAFLTPLSVNIEQYTDGFGLFLPTEPILFGFLLLFLAYQTRQNQLPPQLWRHPIIWAVSFYLFWVFITSITSSHPTVSFKFLLARLWFIVPLLFFGTRIFSRIVNIKRFIWLFSLAMCLTIVYTVTVHATYGFGEKEGHWVMWPFFKDHTIYGSTVAFSIPLIFGLYFSKKHTPLIQGLLLTLMTISVVGLYFSYTRAAWLSIFAALFVLAVIKLRIKFSLLLSVALVLGTTLFFTWDKIQMELERNKYEHTTEEFGEKLKSATNVTTDASNLERLNRWSSAIEMFKHRPIFGFGPGTYAFEYAQFQEPENLTIISTNFGDMGNAHSEYLGPLSEMGFLGLLSILAIVAAIFYKSILLYYRWPEEDKEIRTLLLAMILSLVTYFVHGVLNNYLDTDKAAVPIWSFCAVFIALEIALQQQKKISSIS